MHSAQAKKYEYAIITPEILDGILRRRMLYADLLSRANNEKDAHAARMVLLTLDAIKSEIEGLML